MFKGRKVSDAELEQLKKKTADNLAESKKNLPRRIRYAARFLAIVLPGIFLASVLKIPPEVAAILIIVATLILEYLLFIGGSKKKR